MRQLLYISHLLNLFLTELNGYIHKYYRKLHLVSPPIYKALDFFVSYAESGNNRKNINETNISWTCICRACIYYAESDWTGICKTPICTTYRLVACICSTCAGSATVHSTPISGTSSNCTCICCTYICWARSSTAGIKHASLIGRTRTQSSIPTTGIRNIRITNIISHQFTPF